MASKVLVSEIFGPTFQGEGPSAGKRCGFVRLSTCNLKCTWCDTKYTWDWENYDIREEMHPMAVSDIIDKVWTMNVKRLIFSGGEPMLQQNHIYSIIQGVCKDSQEWSFEIETAGTIAPKGFLASVEGINYNVSPKLAHSGNPLEKRYVEEALIDLRERDASFKFVVQGYSDFREIYNLVQRVEIPDDKVYIMPEGTTVVKLQDNIKEIANTTLDYGWNFSNRMHVYIWGDERGT